jgi:hypothetical protein
VTDCVTSGPVAAETIEETLDAEVKGRVPQEVRDAVDAIVKKRRSLGAHVSRADIIREALHEYFVNHPESANGAEAVR